MTGRTTLILGGARSGKSAWAERLATQSGRPVLYIATATPGDDEMAARIARHRAERPPDWRTIEEPLHLYETIQTVAHPDDAVLVDCLTLWVSNRIGAAIGFDLAAEPEPSSPPSPGSTGVGGRGGEDQPTSDAWQALETSLISEIEAHTAHARERNLALILVSNEVGLGIVPATPLGRRYQDLLGRVNQSVAANADSVILMVAGIPVDLRLFAITPPDQPPRPEAP